MAMALNLEVIQEGSDHLQDFDDEAEDETLSLTDLVLDNNEAADGCWNDFSREDQSSSDDQDLDFFEFFSEDFTASTYPKDNIIFCGKLIPSKEQAVTKQQTHNPNNNTIVKPQNFNKGNKSRIFPWKSHSFHNSRPKVAQQVGRSYKSLPQKIGYEKFSNYDKYDFSMKNISVIPTPMKSKWYLLAFGNGRVNTEMELRDIKNRQRRKDQATMLRLNSGEEMVKKSEKRSGKGFWGLLRVLGYRRSHQQAKAVAEESFGCTPLVSTSG